MDGIGVDVKNNGSACMDEIGQPTIEHPVSITAVPAGSSGHVRSPELLRETVEH